MQKKTTVSDWLVRMKLCARQNIFFFKHIKGSKERFSIYQLGHKHSHDLQKAGQSPVSVKLQNDTYTTVKRLKTQRLKNEVRNEITV